MYSNLGPRVVEHTFAPPHVTHHLFECERRLGCCSLSNCGESDLLEHLPGAGVWDVHEHLIDPLIVDVFNSHGHKSCPA